MLEILGQLQSVMMEAKVMKAPCQAREESVRDIPVLGDNMIDADSKLGQFVAGGYTLIVALAFFCYFKQTQNPVWTGVIIALTFPWSAVVVLLGFLLIHISTHGMDYGFILGAIINCLLLYLLVNAWARTSAAKSADKQHFP